MAQGHHPFAASALGPLPPIPNGGNGRAEYAQHDPLSRPPSNPRMSGGAYVKEPRNQLRAFSAHPFPSSFAELEADRAGWKQKLSGPSSGHQHFGGYDSEGRWRSGGAPQQLGESIELVPDAQHRRNADKYEVVGSAVNGKSRFTLDEHMAVSRSPKGATSAAAAAAAKQQLGGSHPFMSMSNFSSGGPNQAQVTDSPSTLHRLGSAQASAHGRMPIHHHEHLPTAGAPKLAYGAPPDGYPSFFASQGPTPSMSEQQRTNA